MLCRREGRGEEEGARTGYRGGRALHAPERVSPGQLDFDAVSQKCSDRALGQDGVGGTCPSGTPLGPSPPDAPGVSSYKNPDWCGKFLLLMKTKIARFELLLCHGLSGGLWGGAPSPLWASVSSS